MAWFDDDDLRRLAGDKSYQRGVGYVDAIGDLDELADGVVATVHGTEAYQTRLFDRGGALTGECSCPYGQTGAFCKHCVAVGLALLADAPAGVPREPPRSKRSRQRPQQADLRAYLASVDPPQLVDLLLELAADDPVLHRRLSLRAAAGGDPDVAELRRLVDTLRTRRFLDYAASFSYARKADDVLDTLDTIAPDHAATVGPLYRRALQHLTKASEQADDSAGVIGDVAARALDGYAAACQAVPPDPVELARWLVDFQLDGPGWPVIDIAVFAEPLGSDGLATYWRHLTQLHQSLPPAGPGYDSRRWAINHLREGYLTSITGDVDALVALYAEDLPEPYRYVQIGEALRTAGRRDEAIGWLQRGRREAARPDRRIDTLLAELYAQAGRHADALEARWRIFTGDPTVPTHRELADAAERANALAETSDRALGFLRKRASRGGYAADPLVTILLATGDIDAAWAAAREFGCSAGCLFTVAERRARDHPADAIPVYEGAVEAAIDRKNKSGYADAAHLLGVLKDLHRRAGSDFPTYLDTVKDTHRRKKALLTELTSARL